MKNEYGPHPTKTPKGQPISTSRLNIHWFLAIFDKAAVWHDGSYCEVTFRTVASHMKSYEGMTWGQIENRRRYNHPVSKDKLVRKARQRLTVINMDDIDELWRFRFGSKLRIWGIRDRHVFKVLWWDPQHRICPWEPSYTVFLALETGKQDSIC